MRSNSRSQSWWDRGLPRRRHRGGLQASARVGTVQRLPGTVVLRHGIGQLRNFRVRRLRRERQQLRDPERMRDRLLE